MSERFPSQQRERALVALLDDPTPLVRENVVSEFRRLGSRGIEVLRQVIRERGGETAKAATRLIEELEQTDHTRLLRDFIRGMRYELETGLLLINRVVRPEVSVLSARRYLDAYAERCKQLRLPPMTPREQCLLLNRVLFHEAGLRCSRRDSPNPQNSCLESVFQRKTGRPLLLAAIYILVGQRLGLELEPVALPGTFMVGCYCGASPFYVNPVQRGRFHTADELQDALRRMQVLPDFCHLAPVPVGEVLRSCCDDVAREAQAWKDFRMARCFAAFVEEFEFSYRRCEES